ncbi:MAG: DUF349 domain-containing protein [Bacteroides sp.]|nr:DUF349 domain-containing protein [Bacteroides sp.]
MTDPEKQQEVVAETVETVAIDSADKPEKNVHAMSKEELVEALRTIIEEQNVQAHKDVLAIKQALFALRQREVNDEMLAFVEAGNAPEAFSAQPDPLENEGKELVARFKELRTGFLAAEEKRLEENLAKKREILAEMAVIADDADKVNVHFPKFQELQQEFRAIKDVTPSGETEIWKNFQSVVEKFYDTLKMNKDLRDLDFKKNLEAKRKLIADAIALHAENDIVEAGRRLQALHAEWREIGPVVKELRDSIWEEFKEASSVINRKHQEFFEGRKAEEKKNEEEKTALCEKIEAIDYAAFKTFAQWEEATKTIKELQAAWKNVGFASRKANNELFSRFRKACDAFFDAKSAYIQETKDALQANLDRKIALCERAEALSDADDLRKNLDEVVRLQAEWKTIGSVPRKVSDSIWERFTKACNRFFDARKKEMASRHNEENANLETKREIIARLREIPLDIDRREGLRQVRELQARWNETGHVPFKQKDKVFAEYREVCDALYGSFSENRQNERRRNFDAQLDQMKDDTRKMRSERERILRAIEGKRQELQTYTNNLGFFNVKSAAGNSMVKDLERKMTRIKDDIAQLEENLRMLDARNEEKQ